MILKKQLSSERIEQFVESTDLMQHRGPDHKGVYRDGNVVLVHHRLSILDLTPDAHQPFHSTSGRMVAAYNGEIYNFRELAKAHRITVRTRSDTEVMLECFERSGERAIREWNGIFSLAIHDRMQGQLHLMRDRFGVKPLCYLETDEAIVFASEAKVILDWLPEFSISTKALSQYMLYGYQTGSEGFVNGLKRVEPGQHLVVDVQSGRFIEDRHFWTLDDVSASSVSPSEATDRARELIENAVRRQLVSDVPVGLFLSGGIDSSTIAALASRQSPEPLDAYSLEYDVNVGGKSEMERARLVANQFRLNHHAIRLSATEVGEIFGDVVIQYDEPFADPAGVALYQLSRACGRSHRVVLQGDGGDELFGGYRRYSVLQYRRLNRLASSCHKLLPRSRFRQRLERLNQILGIVDRPQLIAHYLTEETPATNPTRMLGKGLREAVAPYSGEEDYIDTGSRLLKHDAVQQLLYTDISILLPWKYLEKVDKATMRFSIESRVPFLDNELAEFMLSLPSSVKIKRGKKKHILKEAMRGLVPDSILFGPKRGFDVPVRAWMQRGLHDHAADLFNSSDPNLIDRNAALEALKAYQTGKLESVPMLWKTMVLAQWFQHYRHKINL